MFVPRGIAGKIFRRRKKSSREILGRPKESVIHKGQLFIKSGFFLNRKINKYEKYNFISVQF